MRYPLALCLLLATLPLLSASAEDPVRRPNVVVLFSDDAGYADFGFQPDATADLAPLTPNIDSIATSGVRFTNAYMSGCVCSPSRAGLMTGRYQGRFGHEHNIPPGYMDGGMDLEHETVADRMQALGYATGIVGKWHLGYPEPYQPNQRGFQWFHGLLQGARRYFPQENPSPHQVIQENGVALPEEGYVTDRFGDAAVRFIEEHRAEPFFLFVSFTAPHGPLQAKPEDLTLLEHIEAKKRRRYAGLVKSLDDNVGKVLEALKRTDLEQDTLLVFTNDNGGQTSTGAINTPLRGRKGMLLEGGIRVPMCLRWPGVVPAGSVIDDPVISLDLLPTFVHAVGGETPDSWALDGIDLGPRLRGETKALAPRPFFWRQFGSGGEFAMRLGSLKLRLDRRESTVVPELYDLSTDIGETTNLAEESPEVIELLTVMLDHWEQQLEQPRWRRDAGRKRRRPAR